MKVALQWWFHVFLNLKTKNRTIGTSIPLTDMPCGCKPFYLGNDLPPYSDNDIPYAIM